MADTLGPLDPARIPAIPERTWLRNSQSGYAYRVQETEASATDDDQVPGWALQAFREAPVPGWPQHHQDRSLSFRLGADLSVMSFVARSAERLF